MKSKNIIGAILILTLLGISACSSLSGAVAGEAGTTCPTPTEETKLLKNEKHGYCLLYPNEFEIVYPNEDETVLTVGSLLNVEDPRVYIHLQEAAGRTVEQVAEELVADIPPVFDIQPTPSTVDGQPAIMLDKLPGQDGNRKLVVINGDRLYQFEFVPIGEDYGELSTRTEALYDLIINSFLFIP